MHYAYLIIKYYMHMYIHMYINNKIKYIQVCTCTFVYVCIHTFIYIKQRKDIHVYL